MTQNYENCIWRVLRPIYELADKFERQAVYLGVLNAVDWTAVSGSESLAAPFDDSKAYITGREILAFITCRY